MVQNRKDPMNPQTLSFGDDPPTVFINNVNIAADGTLFVSQSDLMVPFNVTFQGFHFTITIRGASDGQGTYDRGSGSASLSAMLQTKITSSDAPFFNNDNCIQPATPVNFTTDDPMGGVQFNNGLGTHYRC